MRTLKLATAGLFAALLGGCQTTVQVQSRFEPKPAEAALQPGTNSIKGSAFMRKRAGTIVPAAGEIVYLIPATPYAEERFAKLFPRGKLNPILTSRSADVTDPDYARLMRTTKGDKAGNFTFENVKAGSWFISTRVSWHEPRADLPSGGAIYDRIEIKGQDQVVDVIVSGN
ncbi:MAG: hypothetical protein ACRCUE_07800 [Bosea sp. (in: a-proteobacteria)]